MEEEGSYKPVICDGISMDNWEITFLETIFGVVLYFDYLCIR